LRIVSIDDTDTEACCGTHADNTAEVGLIKVLRTNRISDGIVRLYYVAGEAALRQTNVEKSILTTMQSSWTVTLDEMVTTGDRFFTGYKKLSTQCTKQSEKIIALMAKTLLLDDTQKLIVVASDAASPTMCISGLPVFAKGFAEKKKGIVYVGETWMYGLLGDTTAYDTAPLVKWLAEQHEAEVAKETAAGSNKKIKKADVRINNKVTVKPKNKKEKKYVVTDVAEFTCFALPSNMQGTVVDMLVESGFVQE
jgi:alanyl-tRNA synthetase